MDVLLHAAWHAPQVFRYADVWYGRDDGHRIPEPQYRSRRRRSSRRFGLARRTGGGARS
jgi:hypothetical protein